MTKEDQLQQIACSRGICRRQFLKMAAAAGLLAGCSTRQQTAAPPTDTPSTPTSTPIPTAAPTEEEPMDVYIGYCGYDGCPTCPQYGTTCDGCLTEDGPLAQYAVNCAVRNCNMERNTANCAYCAEYACDKLEDLFASWQGGYAAAAVRAKATLDEIHQSLSQ